VNVSNASARLVSETTQVGYRACVIPLRSMCVNGEPDPFWEVEITSLTNMRHRADRANGQ
jgi:hypothetical protein